MFLCNMFLENLIIDNMSTLNQNKVKSGRKNQSCVNHVTAANSQCHCCFWGKNKNISDSSFMTHINNPENGLGIEINGII